MEPKEIVEGKLGTIGEYGVEYKDGKGIASISAQDPNNIVSVKLSVELAAKGLIIAGLKALKEKIPGQIDDAIIDLAIAKVQSDL